MSLAADRSGWARMPRLPLAPPTDVLEPRQHFYIEVKVMISEQQQQARCLMGIGNEAYKPH